MDKSRPASSRNTSKARTPTCAKFLVQKAAFFGTAKKILTVTQDCILIDNLNNDPRQREEIPFQEITSIKRSPVYDAEFAIVSRKSEAPPIFCANRSRCLADIYIAMDKFIEQENPRLGTNFLKFEVSKVVIPDNHDFYIEVDLFIYRSHLELVNKSLHDPSKQEKQYIEIKNPEFVVGSVTVIPFYSIGTIYKTHKGIVIEMKDSLAQHRLLFYDLEKTNKVINTIQNNYKEFVGAQVDVSTEEFDEGLVPDYVSPKVYKLFFFNTKVYKIIESGHFLPIEIALSDDYLIEIDTNTGLVIQKYELSGVKHVVRLVPGLTGVQVVFEDLTTVMYVPLNQERGLLASNIFTLSSWKKADNVSSTLQDEFIHGATPNNRIQVHGWLEEGGVEAEYEAELIKRFTNSVNDDQLFQILHEFNVNATLKNFNDSDPKPLQMLINLFCKNTKIILSKEFMAFWETYQVYLTHLYPFDFEGQPLGEEDRQKTISECEEKFRQFNDKFQTRQAEKGTTMTLNTQSVPLILYRTEELLKGITLLISSKGLFKEIANNKLDQYRYENFLIETARLIDSPFSPLSHLAGSLFRAFAHFPTAAERKNEAVNKKFLLTSRVKLIQTISESLAKRVLIKHNDSKTHESFYILSILACLRIIKTFIYDRKDTTNPEDFQMILEVISTPYYFAMFNFLSRYRSVACVYDTTIIINSFFQNCTTRDLYKSYQEKFLNNSTLILLHIELVLSSLSVLQRKISVVLLSHLFLENPSACGLICRIFPKNLFRKVDFMSNDISKWTLAQWEQFFSLASKNFDTATEQWNEECRGELLAKLKKIDDDINSRFNWCPQNRIHELFDPTFNHSGEFLLNIRWNHEELEMNYEVLQHKILVWKYYLTNLLEDSENPKFSVPIVNPAKLWNELNIKFTGTHNDGEMKLILKVMVLLYREHHTQVKDLNTMQYWLRCLVNPEFRHCRYLILQLFYTALSVEDISVIRFNVKKFTDIGGIKVVSDVLSSLYFEEDHINLDSEQLEELKSKAPEDIDYNYTKLDIKKQAYTPSLEKSAMILLIINIYKCILYRPIDKTLVLDEKLLYPIPTAKYQIIEQSTVRCLMNVLLLNDDDLALHVLDFFTEYLCDKFTFRSQTDETPLFEFLLTNVTPRTTEARFNLALKIYHRIADEIFPEVNPIKTYSSFLFSSISPQLVSDAFDMFPLFKYFPKHFIHRLITVGAEDVANIYWSNLHETPEIIWNAQMRELLVSRINEKVQPFKHELVKFSESNKTCSKDNMPIYTGGAPEVTYQNVLDEVKVGPVMLRVWIKRPFYNFEIPQDSVPTFIEKLSTLLREYATIQIPQATPKQLEDLLIILKAHAKAIKVYSLTRYSCFKEVLGILSYFSTRLSEEDLTQFHQDILAEMSHFILVLCRILYRAIKLDKSDNSNLFLENGGLNALLFNIQSMIRKISVNTQPELHEYYTHLCLSYHDLKIINLTVRITQRLFVCYPAKFVSLSAEKKLEIFLDLQAFTKIPLILFELIKTQRENPPENMKKRNTEIFEGGVIEEEEHHHPGHVSIFEVITSDPQSSSSDVYIVKIFMFVKNLIDLFSGLSLKIEFATSFVQSGLNWRILELLTYYGENDPTVEKIHKEHFSSVIINVDKLCNVFRNNVIYSNEAYIWKITGGFTSSRGLGIITSSEKSPKLIQSLNKIENPDKMILANFHECVMILLGKHILQMLLVDYFEPVIAPHNRETMSIGSFLKVISTSLHDPATLWNSETRQELKDTLIKQILDINNSHGKLYLNQIEKFRYTLHEKHLIIYDVFVSLYNKTPEWKIANPPQFLLKTMKHITDLWQNLHEIDSDEVLRQNEANLSSTLFNLNEATAAICNVITHHGFEDVLLSEESLTQLGTFLKENEFTNIKDPLLATLKSTCLDIFLNLSKKLSGSLKILENTSILKGVIGLLRSNTKESSILNQKIIKIIKNVAHEDSLKKALINYGFIVFLLESSLKTEIHPAVYRKDVFDFILKVVKNLPVNHIVNQLILTVFPTNIQELIYGTESSDSILETLDLGYDTPKIMWTKMMRHEVLLLLSTESESIKEKWDSYNAKEIRITDNLVFWSELANTQKPVFPDLSENICIDNIYLKNFNKDPNFDSHDNIVVFIDDVATLTSNIYSDFLQKVIEYENVHKSGDQATMSIEDQKTLDKLSYQMVTLLTTLELSLDKLMFHIHEKEHKESLKEFYANQRESIKEVISHLPPQITEQPTTITLEPRGSIVSEPILIMSENALSLIMRGLELFNHLKAHLHILSTQLQLIYLISDNERGFSLLKSYDIISIITKLLNVLVGDQNNNPFTFVEEKMILYLLIKVMLKDQLLVSDAIEQSVAPLKKLLLGNKTYLKPLVDHALTMLIRDPKHGKEIFNELNKDAEIISVETIHNCAPRTLLQNVWKTFTNPYKSDNVLNLLIERSPDSQVTYPAISEYSFASVPHPKAENAKAEQVIKQHMVKIVGENSESAECSHLQ